MLQWKRLPFFPKYIVLWQKWILISLFKRQRKSVASHVALRCFCYYHCAKTIYYSRVPGHKVKERGMNFLLRHAAKAKSAMDKTNNSAPQERIWCVDSEQIRGKEWEALFIACQVVLMGVSVRSQGVVNITHFTEKCMENVGWSSGVCCFEFITVMHSHTILVWRKKLNFSANFKSLQIRGCLTKVLHDFFKWGNGSCLPVDKAARTGPCHIN